MMVHDPERKPGKIKGLGVIAARFSFLAVVPSWNVACMVQWVWDWRAQLNHNWSSCLRIATPDAIACDDGDPNQSIIFTPIPTGGLLVFTRLLEHVFAHPKYQVFPRDYLIFRHAKYI